MPKVLAYTPEWLSRPNPGYHLFAPTQTNSNRVVATRKPEQPGPRRTIATRASEIFVAVGSEIRWADLANLKEGAQPAYCTLRVSIPLPITRLTISPDQDYLAVSTSHTVHVILLPDSSLLQVGEDNGPLKPKTFQLGPTIHVLEESPIATTVWHPLGYHGRCLVTITKAGVVRLWEMNRADRSSFSEPALSIDLTKLANATSDKDDLSASKFGASKGFSPDSVELEVASACFGDFPDQEGVHGWAPMTLWIAMVPGDVYALCPLLPSKWQLVESPGSHTFLQTLTSSININYTEISDDQDSPKHEVVTSEKQIGWLSDILYEEPHIEERPSGDSVKIFARPASTPAVPLLQGPFTIAPEVDDFELSDMIVFSLKTMSEIDDEDDEDEAKEYVAEGLPTAAVCLLTDTSEIHVCLDVEGIVGRWLPSAEDDVDVPATTEHALIVAETITLVEGQEYSFNQSITPDVHTDFSFFVSHASGVFYVSMEPWIRNVEKELSQPQTLGSPFRLDRVLETANSSVERCLQRRVSSNVAEQEVTSVAVIEDGNVGYMLLTTVDGEPQAALLDAPEDDIPSHEELAQYMNITSNNKEVREAWQPPKELYQQVDIYGSVNIPARHKALLKDEIRLSPANLGLLMDVHRVLSAQTSKLQHAVSDLFNRATRLQEEFRDQMYRTSGIAASIEKVTGNDEAGSDDGSAIGNNKIDVRIDKAKARQDQLNARYEALRRKMVNIGASELSEKESNWIEELQIIDSAIDPSSKTLSGDIDGSERPAWQRLSRLKEVQKEQTKQMEEAMKSVRLIGNGEQTPSSGVKVPSYSRKAENEQVQELIQRNTVLVEAAADRLRKLGVNLPIESGS
ncbi:nuclear pore complex an-nup82 [Pyrenophora seminiperda CCB06]|uniref:Nuclear pore complex an-nup82 n=1 Tax=Pyrenophora seminiperda CCB06 TaxID=1302712 RepID=A0A3M7LVW5_9PLEO|nr:nuclear pore complex an-nup82 [Pyrenophora seminiperda CCB06]